MESQSGFVLVASLQYAQKKSTSTSQQFAAWLDLSKYVIWISCTLAAKMSERIPVNHRDWSPLKKEKWLFDSYSLQFWDKESEMLDCLGLNHGHVTWCVSACPRQAGHSL